MLQWPTDAFSEMGLSVVVLTEMRNRNMYRREVVGEIEHRKLNYSFCSTENEMC